MHVLVVFMYYLRSGDPGIKRFNEFCQLWVREHGLRVTVLTGQVHYNTGRVYPDLAGQQVVREDDGDVEVYRIPSPNTFRRGYSGRALSQIGWARNVRRLYSKLNRPDLVLGVSAPLWVSWPTVAAKRRWRIPAIMEIRDLWPEAIVKMGIAPAWHPAIIGMSMLERWSYCNVEHLVTIFEGQKANIAERRLKLEQDITVIPHGVLLDSFEQVPATAREQIRGQLGLNGHHTVVMYAGSHGPLYNLSTLVNVAEALRDRPDIQFVSIGEGWERKRLSEEVKHRQLTNIQFYGPVPASEVPAYLSAADIACSVVNTSALTGWNERTSGTFRNALFDYAAARLPVVFNDPGCTVHEVQDRAHGGLYANTNNGPGEMVDRILYLAEHADSAREMGESNYREIAVRYRRRKMAKVYIELMQQVTTHHRS
jgi:glycosyltransferase involved in cell wall biosynthesis